MAILIGVPLLLLAWLELGPPQVGGRTSYVVTSGISMLPTLHAGDIVVLHRQPSYRVGQVAAYRSAQLKVTVMHRIVGVDGNHYVFKGDHNSWRDSYEPTQDEVLGAEVFHTSGGGRYLERLRTPLVAPLALAVIWMLSFGRAGDRRVRRPLAARLRRHRPPAEPVADDHVPDDYVHH